MPRDLSKAERKLIKQARRLSRRYRVDDGKGFRLKRFDPADTAGLDEGKRRVQELATGAVAILEALQDRLYAQDRWSVLLVFQAMDAAGKDGTIKHVMSGVNPTGVDVHSFKQPSAEELDHDFLWRTARRLPERGRIGIFNRSYYEEVLVARVHPEILAAQKLPASLVGREVWKERFQDIDAHERYLVRNGTVIRKFFLHVSREEQKRRFLERLDVPDKNWKFSLADVKEREHFGEYMEAYEAAIRHTATPWAPWYVVPADHKWFTRLVVGAAIIDALDGLDLSYPSIDAAKRDELVVARRTLLGQDGGSRRRRAPRARRS
jgi:PPK2 family polyphosphate:nucleotide phosphotransferase